MADRPRIAYLYSGDADDVRAVSGTPHHMARALAAHCGDVRFLGPLADSPRVLLGRLVNRLGRAVMGRGFDWAHSRGVSRAYGRRLGSRLRRGGFDLVFAPFAAAELAYLETDLPVVYSTDATFALVHDYLTAFTGLWPSSARAAHEIEARAIARADALVYPTEWAARSAIEHYGASPDRIRVHPFGANLYDPPGPEAAETREPGVPLRLFFLAWDWDGKGGAVALEALEALRSRSFEAELVVCGPTAHPARGHPHVRFVPFLDKGSAEDRERLDGLFRRSHFLILPTKAECYGLAFCEASAYGLPCLASATGGVPGVVDDGVSGLLLDPGATGAEYADRIASLAADRERYRQMARAARRRFETHLNWDAWGRGVAELITSLVG